jgi:hypothetical protein
MTSLNFTKKKVLEETASHLFVFISLLVEGVTECNEAVLALIELPKDNPREYLLRRPDISEAVLRCAGSVVPELLTVAANCWSHVDDQPYLRYLQLVKSYAFAPRDSPSQVCAILSVIKTIGFRSRVLLIDTASVIEAKPVHDSCDVSDMASALAAFLAAAMVPPSWSISPKPVLSRISS